MQKYFLPRSKALKSYSTALRNNATKQENYLWYKFLRNIKPQWNRQRIVGIYILDFYCHKMKLAIELDGSQHYATDRAMDYDENRTIFLNTFGIKVLRFTNVEIDKNFNGVCETIIYEMRNR
jgi:very-short-patch-repair endonuclease